MHECALNLYISHPIIWNIDETFANILRPSQNGHHFADNILKDIFVPNDEVVKGQRISQRSSACPSNRQIWVFRYLADENARWKKPL